jgi:hypothetical protein
VVWEVSVDSTPVRAHQHAAGARKRLAKPEQKNGCPTRSRRKGSAAAAAG